MKRYAFKIQYVGKNYQGSQVQFQNGNHSAFPTIQGEVEKAICTFLFGNPENNNRQVRTIFSGRTDKGVNSLGQTAHFDIDKTIVASSFVYGVNAILPNDISISDFHEVEKTFHAQKSATKRHYRYEFINRSYKNAFDGDLMRVKYALSIERMQQALNYITGEHDFSSFKSSGTLNPSKVCFIYRAECQKIGDKVIIDIEGNRFLYNMVRAIIGTLLDIEGHNLAPKHMQEVLAAKDRTKAGQNVSPYGLTLIEVTYN